MLIDLWTGPQAGFVLAQILLLALAVDAALGDPRWLYRAVPHPVVLIGRLIEAGEKRLYRRAATRQSKFRHGALLTIIVVAAAASAGYAISLVSVSLPGGRIVEAIAVSSLVAFRGLYDSVEAVAEGLKRSLADGRWAVSKIVGRDPESLDSPGVARAAVESLAENFSDGVIAPVFWYCLLGLPGLCAYKAVNTLDSMIGYRTSRYEAFGRFAARLDDAANYLPARLSGLLIVLAAAVLRGAKVRNAWQSMRRDARKHRSPNAGWPEAAMAGALGFALAGPRRYGTQMVDDHWMGSGRKKLDHHDLRRALDLYLLSGVLGSIAGAAALAFFG